MKQEITRILMAALVLLCSVPASAYDAEIDGIFYNLSEQNAIVTRNYSKDYEGDVVIPSSVTYNGVSYSVSGIDEYCFYECEGLTSVVIPNSVVQIGNYALRECPNLKSIKLPKNLKVIPDGFLFYSTGITSIVIPEGVTEIEDCAFTGCSSLASITLPDGIAKVGTTAFEGTPWFEEFPDGLVYIGPVAYRYKGVMPSNTEIVIKDGTTMISGECFWNRSALASVTIPNTVTSIGEGAFRGCGGLTSITIPNSVEEIGGNAFGSCNGLTSVTIPSSVKKLGYWPFINCQGLTSITVESGNTVYDSRDNCNAIIETGTNMLVNGCKYTTIPEGVQSIAWYALSKVAFTSLTLPNSLEKIARESFRDCDCLTSIVIPDGVTEIGDLAFYSCNVLASVSLGKNVKSLDSRTFAECPNLKDVYCHATEFVNARTLAFENSKVDENATLHVPGSLLETYKATAPWSDFKNIVALPTVKCATPTITLLPNGRVKVESATEGAKCVTKVTASSADPVTEAEFSLDAPLVVYTVIAYATAEGYLDSDTATSTFRWEKTENDVNGDGNVDIGDVVKLVNVILGK